MGVRESLLNTITSVADSDFVRIVTSAGASSKATVRNLFKGFESNLGAKSSLTTSDYIRVVGSDNEAYKQSVSAVKDAMGVSKLELKSSYVNSLTGLNNVINSIDNGQPFILAIYSTDLISLLTNNGISAASCQLFGSRRNATYTQYMLCIELSQEVYVGEYNISTGVVSSVYKLPTRTEIDALKNTTTGSFILDSAQSGATSNLVIKQCGKVVSVNGFITGLTLTSSTYIGKISGVSNPASYLRLYANVGWNAYSPGTVSYLAVDTDGSIEITTSATGSNKAVYFSLTYIAA